MLIIKSTIPTGNLPIKKILSKLCQSFIYSNIEDKEHHGYKHSTGKIFKSMNFKISYIKNNIFIKYVAIDKENEKIIAQKVLLNGLKLGEIHISQTELSLQHRDNNSFTNLKVAGFISCAIKDGTSKKKIYLEPKSAKFQEILHNNTIQKYEALLGKPYSGELKITLINQKPKERLFHYSKGVIKSWYGVYNIDANSDMLNMILDSGMGANCMKGLGFVEIVGIVPNPQKVVHT